MTGKIELHYSPDFFCLTDHFLANHPAVTTDVGQVLYITSEEERAEQLTRQWILSVDGAVSSTLPFVSYHRFLAQLLSQFNIPGREIRYIEKILLVKSIIHKCFSRLQYFNPTDEFIPDTVAKDLVDFFDSVRLQLADDEILKNISGRLALSTTDKLQSDLVVIFGEYQSEVNHNNLDEARILQYSIPGLSKDFLRTYYPDLRAVIFEDVSHFKAVHFRLIEKLKQEGVNVYILLIYGRNREIFLPKEQLFNRMRYMADHVQGYPGIKRLSNSLFQIRGAYSDFAPKILIQPAASRLQEVENMAGLIKKWITENGWLCADLAVTGPGLAPYEALIKTVFNRHGIPYTNHYPEAIQNSVVIRNFSLFLRMVLEDYPLDIVQSLFQTPFLNYRDRWRKIDIRLTLSRFRVRSGKKAILDYLAKTLISSLLSREEVDTDECDRIWLKVKECFIDLFHVAEFFEKPHYPREIYRKFVSIINDHRMVEKISGEKNIVPVSWKSENISILSQFLEALFVWQDFQSKNLSDRKMTIGEFYQIFLTIVHTLSTPVKNPSRFGVQLIPFSGILNQRYQAIFVVGMEEGTFPGDVADQFTHPQNVPYNLKGFIRQDRLYQDREFFLQLLQFPGRFIHFSYPRYHQDKPALPSPFLREIKRISKEDLEKQAAPLLLSVNQVLTRILHDRRVKEGEVIGKDMIPEALKKYISGDTLNRINFSVNVISDREKNLERTAWEGILSGDRLTASWFAHRYSGTAFSPTQLERYAQCPMIYFFERLLRLSPFEESDEFLTAQERGQFIHRLLFRFYRENSAEKRNLKILKRTAGILLDALAIPHGLGWELEKEFYLGNEQNSGLLAAFWEFEKNISVSYRMKPRHFELSFGIPLTPADQFDPSSTPAPFEFSDNNENFRFRGKIDRVEVGEDGTLLVVDYKTGRLPTLREMWNGESLQLPVYSRAALSILKSTYPKPMVAGSAFYALQKVQGIDKKIVFADSNVPVGNIAISPAVLFPNPKFSNEQGPLTMDGFVEKVLQNAVNYIRHIRSGSFPHTEDENKCRGWNGRLCQYLPLCRVNRHKISGLNPPAVNPD